MAMGSTYVQLQSNFVDHTSNLKTETFGATGDNMKKLQAMSWQAENMTLGYASVEVDAKFVLPFSREHVSFLKVVSFFSEAI